MTPAKRTAEDREFRAAERQLAEFMNKYTPEIARQARQARKTMHALVHGANELVYDNYNALAIGYSPSEKSSDAVFSIALYPRWISLFFLQGKGLADPEGTLRGSGNVVCHVVLANAADLQRPAIRSLMEQALAKAKTPIDPTAKGKLIIKSVSAKQRPRRPQD